MLCRATSSPTTTGIQTSFQVLSEPETYDREKSADISLSVRWDIIDPAQYPDRVTTRDTYERTRDAYLTLLLRDLRLQTASSYFPAAGG